MTMKQADQWEKTCPLCGGANHCAMAQGEPVGSCWCYSATISASALAAIPPEAVAKRCLCQTCGIADGAGSDDR